MQVRIRIPRYFSFKLASKSDYSFILIWYDGSVTLAGWQLASVRVNRLVGHPGFAL